MLANTNKHIFMHSRLHASLMPTVKLVAYADYNYLIFQGDTLYDVANEASKKTAIAMAWLKKSGMVINAGKTEAAYFALLDRILWPIR